MRCFIDDSLKPFVSRYQVSCVPELDPYLDWRFLLCNGSDIIGFSSYEDPKTIENIAWLNNGQPAFKLPVERLYEDVFYIPFLEMLENKFALDESLDHLYKFMDNPDVRNYNMFTLTMLTVNDGSFFKRAKQHFFETLDRVSIPALLEYNNIKLETGEGDRVLFNKIYPENCPPKKWYKVLGIEVPELLHHVGDWVFIEESEMKHWLWFKMIKEMSTLRTNLWKARENFLTNMIRKKIASKPIVLEEIGKDCLVKDVEDLFKMIPPCVSGSINQRQFPKAEARTALVAIARKTNFPISLIGKTLSDLNDNDPHQPSPCAVKVRFDYDKYYRKGYAPPSCNKMKCPYKQNKIACVAEFDQRWPNHNRNGRNAEFLFGPYSWAKWVLSRRQYLLDQNKSIQVPNQTMKSLQYL